MLFTAARNRYVLRLAGHQSPRQVCAGWDRRGIAGYSLLLIVYSVRLISWLFADNLQISFDFLGGFKEKVYFCGKVERLIENRMEQTVFNPAQMKILQMMAYIKTPQELDNLENVLSQYFAKKVDEGIDELCDNGSITLDTIESWGNEKS